MLGAWRSVFIPFFFFSTPRPLVFAADLELALGIFDVEVVWEAPVEELGLVDCVVVSTLLGFAMTERALRAGGINAAQGQ